MKNRISLFLGALLLTLFSGCSIIGDILEIGIWIGIIIVVAVILIIFAIIRKFKNRI